MIEIASRGGKKGEGSPRSKGGPRSKGSSGGKTPPWGRGDPPSWEISNLNEVWVGMGQN